MPFRLLVLVIFALLFAVAPALAEVPAAPDTKERCPVCGMFVAPYANWTAVLQFKDGSSAYFDGPKDMFAYFFNLSKYRSDSSKDGVVGAYVTDYYSLKLLPAMEVFFVSGSDVNGPMGQELVPIKDRDQAETFFRDHGGSKIIQFDGKELNVVAPQQ